MGLQILILYSLVLFLLLLGWQYTGCRCSKKQSICIHIIGALLLTLIVAFRDGSCLPDYNEYVQSYEAGGRTSGGVEPTFYLISYFAKNTGWGVMAMFFIYALFSVSIRYYAIYKYAPYFLFSLATWASTMLLLHDMIQIRAAVASALLLIILPLLYRRRIVPALILMMIAFFFHRSAIIFLPLLFFNTKKDYWWLWITALGVACIINLLKINIFDIFGLTELSQGIQLVEDDIYSLTQRDMVNIFNPYMLLQIVPCLICIIRIKHIRPVFPEIGLFLKTALTGIIIYSFSLGVVSTRLAELLSTALIFVYPCALNWYSGKYRVILGKITITAICLMILTNFIFWQDFISHQ